MEIWFLILVSLCISALLKSFFNLILNPSSSSDKKLPPGPPAVPVIGNLIWLRHRTFANLELVLRDLRPKYGPIITLRIGSRRPVIFVSSHSIAHQALVQNAAVFSDRPKAVATSEILNINSAAYGSTWRLLRRNLTSEILNPSRVKSYSRARQWVLTSLIERLLESGSGASSTGSTPAPAAVKVIDHFQYAMFCLLVLMCFGDRLDDIQIKQIEKVQRQLLLAFRRLNILNLWPRLGTIVFRNRWKELRRIRREQEDVLIPLIRDRMEVVKRRRQWQQQGKQDEQKIEEEVEEEEVVAYVDSLLDLELPDEKRKLNEGELVSLCGEFLNAGTDTTSTVLQWIMANLVKYPRIQAKLYEEIVGVMGPPPQAPPSKEEGNDQRRGKGGEEKEKVIKEEDLQRMPYLKAVILEGLRRHPPGHFVLPHTVTEDVELEGHLVPKNAMVNFMVAEMGWDPKVWDEPMEFKPERFLGGGGTSDHGGGRELSSSLLFDITGRKEIKMMPFGAGRRICPASSLAMLHLELFVANLVWYFEWKATDGDVVDLSEKQEFTIVMKNPLRAHISPRATTTGHP